MTRDELVWKMVKEFEGRCIANYSQGNPVDSMSAALGVCVEELLGREVTKMEWSENFTRPAENGINVVNGLLAARRAHYSLPKPKTPEEVLRENLYAILAGTGSDVELYVPQIMELIAELKEQK